MILGKVVAEWVIFSLVSILITSGDVQLLVPTLGVGTRCPDAPRRAPRPGGKRLPTEEHVGDAGQERTQTFAMSKSKKKYSYDYPRPAVTVDVVLITRDVPP